MGEPKEKRALFCPLLRDSCKESACAWWHAESCAVKAIGANLPDIAENIMEQGMDITEAISPNYHFPKL